MTVKVTDIHSLPVCPSPGTLRTLHPSEQAAAYNHISSTLQYALSLSDEKLSKLLCSDFIASYARGVAAEVLNSIIFPDDPQKSGRKHPTEAIIRKRVLVLAQRLALLPKAGGLSFQVLLDLCIVFGPKNVTKVRNLLEAAVESDGVLAQELQHSAIPVFASVLISTSNGLHAIRKTVYCIKCLVHCSPPSLLDIISKNTDFILAIAKCYDSRLSTIASAYGGINIDSADTDQKMWLYCKIDLMDSFHIILKHILKSVQSDPRTHIEHAFDTVFSLLNLPSSSGTNEQVPFLNRSLLADYQDSYNLSSSLASVLANHDDPRLDVLESTLRSFELNLDSDDRKGALRILIRSSGIPQGIDHRGIGSSGQKGKARAATPVQNIDYDTQISTVLDILPDNDPSYIRHLLELPQYSGDAEKVIAALLEGQAPSPSDVAQGSGARTATPVPEPLPERRNVFSEQHMDISNVNVGKRKGDAEGMLQDRSFLDQMKQDILRRVAELSESDEEVSTDDDAAPDSDNDGEVKVVADGEGSGDEDEGEGTTSQRQKPEIICELAYIKDPKAFDRDAQTRRSKGRADLKAQTGWTDEQIEGWRIMLERNVCIAIFTFYLFRL